MPTLLNLPLEKLIAKATGFELSPMPLALIKVANGVRVPLLQGAVREAAELALGYSYGPDRTPRVLFLNAGARSGKTMLASYIATHRALACDLSGMAPGEECRVGFVSASMRQARAGLNYSKGLVRALSLGAIITSERRDSYSIRRDGHTIEFAVIRGNAGSDSMPGHWYAALVVHECGIAVEPASHGTPLDLDAVEKAVRPRLLPARGKSPGGLIIEETTSRDAAGPAYDRVHDHHGKPDAPILVFKGTTLEMRPNDAALREHVEAERATDPINAAREFDCEWLSAGSGGYVFGADLIDPCVSASMPTKLPPEPGLEAWAGVDLGFTGDGSALAIVRKRPTRDFELASLVRWKPARHAPLKPSEVIGAMLDECERHGVRLVLSDVHHREQLQEIAQQRRGVRIVMAPPGAAGKERTHADAQEVFASKAFKMGRDPLLLRSLHRIVAIRTPDGAFKIRSPRRKGDHGDDSSALVLALHAAHRYGGRGFDHGFAGRVSLYQQALGLIDASGRSLRPSAAIEFSTDSRGHANANPGRPQHQFSSSSAFSKQRAF